MPGHRPLRVLWYPADDPFQWSVGALAHLQRDDSMDTLAQQIKLTRCDNATDGRHHRFGSEHRQQAQVVGFVQLGLDAGHAYRDFHLCAQVFLKHALNGLSGEVFRRWRPAFRKQLCAQLLLVLPTDVEFPAAAGKCLERQLQLHPISALQVGAPMD
ncbi:hypothetical protein D3C81_1024870 [compost metagenome]